MPYTSEAGSWSIEYNDHKITYCTPAEHYIAPEDDGEELDGIDTQAGYLSALLV